MRGDRWLLRVTVGMFEGHVFVSPSVIILTRVSISIWVSNEFSLIVLGSVPGGGVCYLKLRGFVLL